jgi:phage shock protein E
MKSLPLTMAVLTAAMMGCGNAAPPPADAAAAPAPLTAAAPAAAADPAGSATPAAASRAAAEAGPVLLDVRTPEEFAAGHVEGTLHIPLQDLERRQAELEPFRDRDIVVYCRSGRRAASAIQMLQANGFSRLSNGGGLTDMSARGHAITR